MRGLPLSHPYHIPLSSSPLSHLLKGAGGRQGCPGRVERELRRIAKKEPGGGGGLWGGDGQNTHTHV